MNAKKNLTIFTISFICGLGIGYQIQITTYKKEDPVVKFVYKGDVQLTTDLSFEKDTIYASHVDPYGVNDKQEGVIPDPQTAANLAEIILFPIYGEQTIIKQRPYKVQLQNNHLWSISGTLPSGSEGGCFHLLVEKKDGKILLISHEK